VLLHSLDAHNAARRRDAEKKGREPLALRELGETLAGLQQTAAERTRILPFVSGMFVSIRRFAVSPILQRR